MNMRRWFVVILGVAMVGGAIVLSLPEVARRVAVAQIHAYTGRPVSIEAVELNLLTGRFTVRGVRLTERDGMTPFAGFERLDVSMRLPSLLFGHLWIRELVLSDSTVHVVRLPTGEFNLSDLIRSAGTTRKALDVTVDRFAVVRGSVTLEDRAVSQSRTWTSEEISIEARRLSTRREDGSAVAHSVTAGAPVSMEVTNLRLYPMHLQASVTIEGLDLALARVYFPPDAPVTIDRGRASTSVTVVFDARDGLRANASSRFEDVALVRVADGGLVARVPRLAT